VEEKIMNWKKVKNGLKTAGKIFGISILNSMITFSSNLEENRHRTDYVDRLYQKSLAKA